MADAKAFRIIVATDGSSNARGTVTTARDFPWPAGAQVRVVVARRVPLAARELAREVRRTNTIRARAATKELNRASARLKERTWETRTASLRALLTGLRFRFSLRADGLHVSVREDLTIADRASKRWWRG